jgi:acyl-coenzyme A synthetase/AMP-(fatty) acid ligase
MQEMVERLQITSLSLYPNVIKDLMKYSDEWTKKYDISKLKTISLGL